MEKGFGRLEQTTEGESEPGIPGDNDTYSVI